MADVLAQFCRVASELIAITLFIGKGKTAIGTIQTTLDGCFARRSRLTHGIGVLILSGAILRDDPRCTDEENRQKK